MRWGEMAFLGNKPLRSAASLFKSLMAQGVASRVYRSAKRDESFISLRCWQQLNAGVTATARGCAVGAGSSSADAT